MPASTRATTSLFTVEPPCETRFCNAARPIGFLSPAYHTAAYRQHKLEPLPASFTRWAVASLGASRASFRAILGSPAKSGAGSAASINADTARLDRSGPFHDFAFDE